MACLRKLGFKAMRQFAFGALLLLFPLLAFAQNYVFGPNVRVNDDHVPGNGYSMMTRSGQHCIAARGDTVYLVWQDTRSGDNHAYFARSTNGGQSFEPNIRLDRAVETGVPSLALDDSGGLHACWCNRNANLCGFTYYARSTNGGRTFGVPVRACDSTQANQGCYPSVAVSRDGRRVYVAQDYGYDTIWLSRSTDGGTSFLTPDIPVCADTIQMTDPTVAVYNDTIVLVAWDAPVYPAPVRVFAARSTNGGASFGPPALLSTDTSIPSSIQCNPSTGVDSTGRVRVVWRGMGDSYALGMAMSDDTGRTFSPAQVIPLTGDGDYPSLFVQQSGRLYLSWHFYYYTGQYYVRFAYSPDGGDSFCSPVDPLDEPGTNPEFTTVTANERGQVFLAWVDGRDTTGGIYFATGTQTGVEEAKGPDRITIACDVSPNPTTGPLKVEYFTQKTGLNQAELIDCTGKCVEALAEAVRPAGRQTLEWSGHGTASGTVPSGVYFLRLTTPDGEAVKKVQIVRE